jgi:peptidoglycan hydrolase FlgJ
VLLPNRLLDGTMMHATGYSEFTAMPQKGPNAKDWSDIVQPVSGLPPPNAPRPRATDEELARAARDLEASFLSIMLREAGVGAPRNAFGGGSGEEQFSSFLTDAYAARIAERGGIGLAESLFKALKETADGRR